MTIIIWKVGQHYFSSTDSQPDEQTLGLPVPSILTLSLSRHNGPAELAKGNLSQSFSQSPGGRYIIQDIIPFDTIFK